MQCMEINSRQQPAHFKTCDICYYGCTCRENHDGCCTDHAHLQALEKEMDTAKKTYKKPTEVEGLRNAKQHYKRLARLLQHLRGMNNKKNRLSQVNVRSLQEQVKTKPQNRNSGDPKETVTK